MNKFERNKDPKESLGVGMGASVKERLQEMLIAFNEEQEEKIISIFDMLSHELDMLLVIKGQRLQPKIFFKLMEEYLIKFDIAKYLDIAGKHHYGAYSFPLAKYRIISHSRFFNGIQIDY